MELHIFDKNFIATEILENAESVIWTERYQNVGDFELYFNFDLSLLNVLKEDYYIKIKDSDETMVIESLEIDTKPESGNKLVVKGRSLASILDRRIVLAQTILDTTFQNGILTLLNNNVINSIYPERNINNFVFVSSSDPAITSLSLKGQYYSQYILDVIVDLCEKTDVGFKVNLNASNTGFEFRLYKGVDRSYNQLTNPFIVFSPAFDNLINSEYFQTSRYKKTYALITGQAPSAYPAHPIRRQVWLNGINTSNLERREMHVDASDISIYDETSGTEMSDAVYGDQLVQRGNEEISKNTELVVFDGQVDLSRTYTYRTDFFLGDLIQISDSFGHENTSRVDAMTFSENLSGYSVYPTLKTV